MHDTREYSSHRLNTCDLTVPHLLKPAAHVRPLLNAQAVGAEMLLLDIDERAYQLVLRRLRPGGDVPQGYFKALLCHGHKYSALEYDRIDVETV